MKIKQLFFKETKMIKLKNLWKIALATMAMSAMLVACEEPSSNNSNESENLGGEGVYSYTVDLAKITNAWGGSVKNPAFSVLLLTDEQLKACQEVVTDEKKGTKGDFKQATSVKPEYQIAAYGNMRVRDTTSDAGDFAVYGNAPIGLDYQYYNGVVATVTKTSFTLTVDMTKLVKTDLKALFKKNAAGKDEAIMTADHIVDLKGYKPYVIALGGRYKVGDDFVEVKDDNRVMTGWNADLMKMTDGATLPANAKKDAPVVPKVSEMKFVCSNFGNFPITFSGDVATCEITYALANATGGQKELAGIEFGVCSDTDWSQKYCGAEITALGKAATLKFGVENNNKVDAEKAKLAEGKTYVLTINSKDFTVTVTEKK